MAAARAVRAYYDYYDVYTRRGGSQQTTGARNQSTRPRGACLQVT